MQNSQLPLKWYKPFAADDSAKVEIPVTTSDPERASQSLGFPPLTMQPPESGGVPPQGEDFNGAMNQIARIAWWLLAGGALPFDNAWATNANIVGYPRGAAVDAADLQGEWISTADNNTNNPDTVGTGWVPGYAYGATTVAMAAANTTLTPAQAAKSIIIITGVLTANVQLIFPSWVRTWTIVNNATGNFSVTCKTAAGSGVVAPPQASSTVWGDGTNLLVAGLTNAQVTGVVGSVRNLKAATGGGATLTITADEVVVETALGGYRYCVPNVNSAINLATTGAGGMDTGASPTGFVGVYLIHNPLTGAKALLGINANTAVLPQVYGGANMPSGYTASALVSVAPCTPGVFGAFSQVDRCIEIVGVLTQSTSSPTASPSSFAVGAMPKNAVKASGNIGYSSTAAASGGTSVFGYSSAVGAQGTNVSVAAGGTITVPFRGVPVQTPQFLYYTGTNTAGTPTFQVTVGGYEI